MTARWHDKGTATKIRTRLMATYAEKGLAAMNRALCLSEDYFVLERDAFLRRWMSGRAKEIRLQTMGTSWRMIVVPLDNPMQAEIVLNDHEQANVLARALLDQREVYVSKVIWTGAA
ncbi:hypothetical protein [Cypionkella sp.]|uniref:hypothetical protein n=1 Tax=Cypionkella sp. TaxID=2811411 RepID=UPI00272066ED|nr:hypothetical protein [Cypionkella sp.]MDO8985958.1 hypothetical protein [Cypionkella sp.]MDP2048146.1 hypothetical protein [Cypionkella sp.]